MTYKPFFWLHIKKSAGVTIRSLLQPYYVTVDRSKKPKTFIQSTPEEYNDILNNYRVVLGEYQFKRCLFAKTYLYPNTWDSLMSFAMCREPTDRCLSMFYYLFWQNLGLKQTIVQSIRRSIENQKMILNTSYAFDVFLDYAQKARFSDSIYDPISNHFTTHTAPMWDDITDQDGQVLLKHVFRLESLREGIALVLEACGLSQQDDRPYQKLNITKGRQDFQPTKSQRQKIEAIYAQDFELYEKAWH